MIFLKREKNYWLIIHNIDAYQQHKDAIGLPIKKDSSGNPIPKLRITNDIQIGDEIYYYCPSKIKGFIGIFRVISEKGMFYNDWEDSIQFKIEPIKVLGEKNNLSLYDIKDELKFFKNSDGNTMGLKQIGSKLRGSIKDLTIDDANVIRSAIEDKLKPPQPPVPTSNAHLDMILVSHKLSSPLGFSSYIGTQERNRIRNLSRPEYSIQNELPDWLQSLAKSKGTRDLQNIQQIDNIWFIEEKGNLLIPTMAFEHERTDDLRNVMDRFMTLKNTLNVSDRFKSIKPIYIIVTDDERKKGQFERKIREHSEWKNFKESESLEILTISDLKERSDDFLTILSSLMQPNL